jgi:hypothetical protein
MEHTDIPTLTTEIVQWADSVFPNRKAASALLKLFEEVGELVRDPSSPGEYADICIMLFDLAHMHKVDLARAITDKMAVNRKRMWTVTANGTMQHADAELTGADPKRQAYLLGLRDAREGTSRNPEHIWSPTLIEWYDRGYTMGAGEDVY